MPHALSARVDAIRESILPAVAAAVETSHPSPARAPSDGEYDIDLQGLASEERVHAACHEALSSEIRALSADAADLADGVKSAPRQLEAVDAAYVMALDDLRLRDELQSREEVLAWRISSLEAEVGALQEQLEKHFS